MKPGQCLLCLEPKTEYIANKVVKKELTNEQAAKELEVPLSEWIAHYELHVRNKLVNIIAHDLEPIKKNFFDKILKGTESMERLIGLTEKISKRLENEDIQRNIKLIATYAQLERNVISGLKELAVLEGDFKQAETINVYNNTIKIEKLMAIVMEDAPPDFKDVILRRLENITE